MASMRPFGFPGGADPFRELRRLQEEMDRLAGAFTPAAASFPAMNLYAGRDGIAILAELPGVAKEDVEVMLDRGDLVIKGERKSEHEVKEENYYQMERSFGSFYRRLPMPEGVQADQLSASFKDGVLEVRTPKPATSGPSPTKITIH
jgi:HSP20 family protein